MKIGIDSSRAFLKNRTGIEEYSYQVIKNLRDKLKDQQVVLYVRKTYNLQLTRLDSRKRPLVDARRATHNKITTINNLELPENWQVRVITFPRFWTQLGLSLEMLLHPVDVLFIPAHTVPIIHPENTVVVMHGLEYEFCPEAYSLWERIYMRVFIKNSCGWAKKIISVSENTKKDLMNLYNVPDDKISVIYEGYTLCHSGLDPESRRAQWQSEILKQIQDDNVPYLLFIGRIEERKNITNIIKAFEILKEKYKIPHKLILAGRPGYGYENLKSQISNLKFNDDVLALGFVSEEEKWELLKKADVFVFPTLYEGFGIPVLEAQSVGCPVVASNNSSVPEIVRSKSLLPLGEGARRADEGREQYTALLVDPQNPQDIAENIYKIISNETLKNAIIAKGLENVKRFSWDKCSQEISEILLKKN